MANIDNKTKQSFYNFRNEGEVATIDIFAEIDDWWGYTAGRMKNDLDSFKGQRIIININSAGGSVTEGLAIAALIKAENRHVTTRAIGVAASIASVILLAGDTVEMDKNSFIMIHNVWGMAAGEAEEFRQMADTMDNMSNQITEIYLDAVKKNDKYDGDRAKTKKKIKDLMSKETWLNAKQAKELGLIDKIQAFKTGASASNSVRLRLYNQIRKNFKTLPENMKDEEKENEEIKNGANLADALNAKIEMILAEEGNEEMTRAEIVQSMADAAGISTGTVNQILNAEIDCPPLDRLEGFAEALSMPMEEIMSAAESDGCSYGEEEETEEGVEDCVDCQKAKEKEESNKNKGLIQTIKGLLGFGKNKEENKKEEVDPSTGKEEIETLNKAIADLRKKNEEIKASLIIEIKAKKEAIEALKEVNEALSKIKSINNRAGKPFRNIEELLVEYQALIEHNKETGGLPVESGTPLSDVETTNAVEKRQVEHTEDLRSQFEAIKDKLEKQRKEKAGK